MKECHPDFLNQFIIRKHFQQSNCIHSAVSINDSDWLWCLYSGSAPSQYPLGEIQLTVRHSSQRNKLIVVVHACRWGPIKPHFTFKMKEQQAACPFKPLSSACPQELDSLHQRWLRSLHPPVFAAWQEPNGEEENQHDEEDPEPCLWSNVGLNTKYLLA